MGATKFTRDEMIILLDSVELILPVEKKHWELVQEKYMIAHKEKVDTVNDDFKKVTGKNGTMKVTERSHLSLERLFNKLLVKELSKGKYSGSHLTVRAKKIDKLIKSKYGMFVIGFNFSDSDDMEEDIEVESSDNNEEEEELDFSGSRFQTIQKSSEAYFNTTPLQQYEHFMKSLN